MKTYYLTIAAPHGLHLRVAARIVELVRRSGAKVSLFGPNERRADGASLISLMCLDVSCGHTLRVEIEGGIEEAIALDLDGILSGREAAAA